MLENFQKYNYPENKEKKQDNFSDSKNIKDKIKKESIDFYKKNQNNQDSIQGLKTLLATQNKEELQLFELIKTQKEFVLQESKTNIDKIRLENYEKIIKQIKNNLIDIQKTKDENFDETAELLDNMYFAFFGGKTAGQMYKESYDKTKNQALLLLDKILKNIKVKNLSEFDKTKYIKLVKQIKDIGKSKLQKTPDEIIRKNEKERLPERLRLLKSGIKGEAMGVLYSIENIYKGTIEIGKLMIEWTKLLIKIQASIPKLVNKEFRNELSKELIELSKILSQIKGKEVIEKIKGKLIQELNKFRNLPPEKQAEKIGNVFGEIIGTILTMEGVGALANKLKKFKILKKFVPGAELEGEVINGGEKISKVSNEIEGGVGKGIKKGEKNISKETPKIEKETKLGKLEKEKLIENINKNFKYDLDFYDTPEKMNGLKGRLGLQKTATIEEIKEKIIEKLIKVLEIYKIKGKENLKRIKTELIEEMKRKGIKKPEKIILKELNRLKKLKKDEDIMVVTFFKEEDLLKIQKSGLKSAYQRDDIPFSGMPTYGKYREWTDIGLNIHGLDPKYGTVIIEKSEFDYFVKTYKMDYYIKHRFEDLVGKTGCTYYDSILTGRKNGTGLDTMMLNFEDILESQALINIEKKYGLGKLNKLKEDFIVKNGPIPGENKKMINNIEEFVELQIFGKIGKSGEIIKIPKK